MKITRHKSHPHFVDLPRHKRGDAVIALKGQMRKYAKDYGGRFTSHLVLDEPDRPDLYNQWFDFYFPGRDKFTIWNASIITAKKDFWAKVSDLAYARASAMLSPQEMAEDSKLDFEPADRSSTGKILTYKLRERRTMRFEQFGGLTFMEYWDKLQAEIARNEPPQVFESFKTDRGYRYGIGLHIVVDTQVINRASIEAAMDRFFALGEVDWTASEPVARDRLPAESQREAFDSLRVRMAE